jgi:hypothetical protein
MKKLTASTNAVRNKIAAAIATVTAAVVGGMSTANAAAAIGAAAQTGISAAEAIVVGILTALVAVGVLFAVYKLIRRGTNAT